MQKVKLSSAKKVDRKTGKVSKLGGRKIKKSSEVKNKVQQDVLKLFKEHSIVKVDLGCGENKQPGTIGIDFRKVRGVDVVQDLSIYPWNNIPSDSIDIAYSSHLLEHINPAPSDPRLAELLDILLENGIIDERQVKERIGKYRFLSGFVSFMDEVWRILKPGGQFISVFPYGGSAGYIQDPSHINQISHTTLTYFDPLAKTPHGQPYNLYNIYRPKPWKIVKCVYDQNGFIEVALEKRRIDKSYNTLADEMVDENLN